MPVAKDDGDRPLRDDLGWGLAAREGCSGAASVLAIRRSTTRASDAPNYLPFHSLPLPIILPMFWWWRRRWSLLNTSIGLVAAQSSTGSVSTNAQCQSNWNWTANSLNQSPCLVAAYLQSACFSSGGWLVDSLGPGQVYLPPNSTLANACQCNTVTYNLLSACAGCQDRGWVDFDAWVSNCPQALVKEGSYPFDAPAGTTIPLWAYLDSSSGTFNPNAAFNDATNTTSSTIFMNTSRPGLSTGAIVAIVLVVILLLTLPLVYLFFRRNPHLRPGGSSTKPSRLKSLFLGGTDHHYDVLSKGPNSPPIPLKLKRRVTSEPAPPDFTIDVNTPVDADPESQPLNPESTGSSSSRLRPSPLKKVGWSGVFTSAGNVAVMQQEDLGSAVDFTFVSSNAASQSAGSPPTTSSANRKSFASTLYPSDSVSNLQIAPKPSVTPEDRRRERERQEAEALAQLAELEEPRTTEGVVEDDETEILSAKFSAPPQRSRLEQLPPTNPVMMYPGVVRGNVRRLSMSS